MLISIEGNDASGKQTQSKLLYEYLQHNRIESSLITFPNYAHDSSMLVRMYLSGKFGDKPDDVNAKTASILFACDRFGSYKTQWEEDYRNGKVIIADRYTTSNAIHQASKIHDAQERDEFLDWLFELEYDTLGLPKPDMTIFLNMPFEISSRLMKERSQKAGEAQKDIHESDLEYLERTNKNAIEISKKLGWLEISCVNDKGNLKTVEEIHQEIISLLHQHYEFKK